MADLFISLCFIETQTILKPGGNLGFHPKQHFHSRERVPYPKSLIQPPTGEELELLSWASHFTGHLPLSPLRYDPVSSAKA